MEKINKMNDRKTVSNLIGDLTFEQSMQFAIACVNRIQCFTKLFLNVNLEKYFASLEDVISKDKFEKRMNTIIYDLNHYQSGDFDGQKHRDLLSHFLIDDILLVDHVETVEDIEDSIIFTLSHIFSSILDYIYWHDCMHLNENDVWHIGSCSEYLISIAKDNYKISKFGKYHQDQYEEEIKEAIDSEIKKQIIIIKMIKEGDKKLLHEYIEENKFEYKGRPVSV
jgi:hypothetical protein